LNSDNLLNAENDSEEQDNDQRRDRSKSKKANKNDQDIFEVMSGQQDSKANEDSEDERNPSRFYANGKWFTFSEKSIWLFTKENRVR